MTSLYLTTGVQTGVAGGAETTKWRAGGSAGGAATRCNKNGVAGPTVPLLVTDSQVAGTDGNTVAWYSDPVAAVTIAGAITALLWGGESASAANSAPCVGVYRCDPTGAVISAIVDPATAGSQGAGELDSSGFPATKTCTMTAGMVTDTTLNPGDRIKITLCIDDAVDQGGSGSMTAAGRSSQLYVNGSNGQSGQSQIQFTEVLASVGPAQVAAVTAGRMTNAGREAPVIIAN